ncbi:Nn.00g089580.m01.CDS01 [Neocucurbitaria sp. VM-36]
MFASLLGEAKKGSDAPAKSAPDISGADQRPREFPVQPVQSALPEDGLGGSSIHYRTQRIVAASPTPFRRPDDLSLNGYRPDRNRTPSALDHKQPSTIYNAIVENKQPQYYDDRTDVQCEYGIATPWEAPIRNSTPPIPDMNYRPRSPDLSGLPHANRIVRGRVEKNQRDSSNNRYASVADLYRYYSIPQNNIIPAQPNPYAKPNRYGCRYGIEPSVLAKMATWVESHPDAARVDTGLPKHHQSYNGPTNPSNTPWKLGRLPGCNDEAFDYTQWSSVATAAGTAQPGTKAGNISTGLERSPVDRPKALPNKPHVQVRAARPDSINRQQLPPKQQSSRHSSRPKNDYCAPAFELRQQSNIPTRFRYHDTYKALSFNELQNEAELRRLTLEKDDVEYLVEVLIINDKTFNDCYHELEHRSLSTEQLRDEVIMKQVHLDLEKHYPSLELLAEIAGKVSRDAVDAYNQQLKHKEAADIQAANERAKKRQRQERARKAQEAEVEKAKSSAAQLMGVAALKPQPKKTQQKKEQKSHGGSQISDSGYSTGQVKSSTSPDTSGLEYDPNQGSGNESKSKKRPRSDLAEVEGISPSKKVKQSSAEKATRNIKPKRVRISKPLAQSSQYSKDSSGKIHTSRPTNSDVQMSNIEKPPVVKLPKQGGEVVEQRKAPAPSVQKQSKRRTRSSRITEDLEPASKKQDKDDDSDSEEFMDDDDWLVDDTNYKPKRKSRVAAMAASGLFAGMK